MSEFAQGMWVGIAITLGALVVLTVFAAILSKNQRRNDKG